MEIIARAAALGVRLSVNESNGKLHVEGQGDVPKPFLNQVREMRDQLVLALAQGGQARLDLAHERHRPFMDDVRRRRPPDVRDADWAAALRGLRAFLAVGYDERARRLGWSKDELFAVPRLWARGDLTGGALAIGDRTVSEVTVDAIAITTASGAALRIYRNPELNYAATYRARIKSLGEDSCKEEFQLRTFESVVAIYCANNPSATIDQAAAAVRSAINGEAT